MGRLARLGWMPLLLSGCMVGELAVEGRPCQSDGECGPEARCELATKRCVKGSALDARRSEARLDALDRGTPDDRPAADRAADQRSPDLRPADLPPPACDDTIQNGKETDVDCGGSCPQKCADGKKCAVAADCSSVICQAGICVAANCTNGKKDGSESDIDCGGLVCAKCPGGKSCVAALDCVSKICAANVCTTPSCSDKVQNGSETDLDCGGSCPRCSAGKACLVASDCTSSVCVGKVCQPASCSDGVKNGGEGDVDCGGSCPSRCAVGKSCNVGSDCVAGVCSGGTCAAASCSDGVKNGSETDVDCGGTCAANCQNGKSCLSGADCVSATCLGGKCVDPCSDGVKDGNETDVDCGGSCTANCADGKGCLVAADCQSQVCSATTKLCLAPTCSDGVQNGSETGIDCGGSCAACGGTCPMLYTWDGASMRFESDLFPRGMLGLKYAAGYLKPNPHDYYLLRHPPATRSDGLLDLRLIEERFEVDYLDQATLYALDVPAARDVYSEILFVGTSYLPPAQVLHTVALPLQQLAATHLESGKDVSAILAQPDGQALVLSSDRNNMAWQTLELDLGAIASAPQVKLVIDARSAMPNTPAGLQAASALELPGGNRTFLQVRDASGAWVSVPKTAAALPIPKEFPRPFVVDLTQAFVADRQKIRLGFLYKTYVDAIRLDTSADLPVTIAEVPLAKASLGYHGLDQREDSSEMALHVYGQLYPVRPYPYFPGFYTAFTDVSALLASVDDLFVVFGPGDEVTLRYGPEPAKAAGATRRYLLYTNGYYKSDKATTIPWTVAPLPFAAMSGFPYDPLLESYPTDPLHLSYLSTYNTRLE